MPKISKADKKRIADGLKQYRVRQPIHTYTEKIVWARDEQDASDVAAATPTKGYAAQLEANAQCDGSDEVEEV